MDLKKKREYINRCLIEISTCKDSDKFYELCTGLYYHINEFVFYMENEKLKCEVDLDVWDYWADCYKWY